MNSKVCLIVISLVVWNMQTCVASVRTGAGKLQKKSEQQDYYLKRAVIPVKLNVFLLSCENIALFIAQLSTIEATNQIKLLRSLDFRQRKALALFREYDSVTSAQIGQLFGFKPRTNSQLCKKWVEGGFLEIVDSSKKGRKYKLSDRYLPLLLAVEK